MNWIKSILKKGFNRVGYNITRINKKASGFTPHVTERQIVNAYYKGHCFKCFYGDYLCESILAGRGWDNNLEGILKSLSVAHSQGDIIEVGANIGASLIPIACQFPNFNFHCVEPIPDFFALLKANAESFQVKNVELYNVALSSKEGQQIEIHTQVGTAGALPQYDIHTPVGVSRLQTATVDSLFSDKDVRFFKLDVDGFELEVLKGAVKTLTRYMPDCFVEFHTKIMYKLSINPKDVTDFFENLGYNSITIYEGGEFIKKTTSYNEVRQIADAARYYIDILLQKTNN